MKSPVSMRGRFGVAALAARPFQSKGVPFLFVIQLCVSLASRLILKVPFPLWWEGPKVKTIWVTPMEMAGLVQFSFQFKRVFLNGGRKPTIIARSVRACFVLQRLDRFFFLKKKKRSRPYFESARFPPIAAEKSNL